LKGRNFAKNSFDIVAPKRNNKNRKNRSTCSSRQRRFDIVAGIDRTLVDSTWDDQPFPRYGWCPSKF